MNWKFWKREKKEKVYVFPCASDECLVRIGNCTQACDKIITDEDKLIDLFYKYECCPDCGSKHLYEGPSGGMCTNVKCARCGHWFNLGMPLIAERIHFDKTTRRFLK